MNHPIYHMRTVEIVEPYTLRVQFADDTEQIVYTLSRFWRANSIVRGWISSCLIM